jgi:GTP cyclohydrolase I
MAPQHVNTKEEQAFEDKIQELIKQAGEDVPRDEFQTNLQTIIDEVQIALDASKEDEARDEAAADSGFEEEDES